MLHCIYHINGEIRVVEDDEKDELIAKNVWFDHPTKAKEERNKHERLLDEKKPRRRKTNQQERNAGSRT